MKIYNFDGLDISVGRNFENVPNSAAGIRFFMTQARWSSQSAIEHHMGVPKRRITDWIENNSIPECKFEKFKKVCEGFY